MKNAHSRDTDQAHGHKVCFKCKVMKPLIDFYRHSQMGDGHLNKCKECAKHDVKEHRKANIQKIRQYDCLRAKQPHRKKRAIQITKNRRDIVPGYTTAHNKLSRSLAIGVIKRPLLCQKCGAACTPHGHHEDYSKPLEVIWLCAVCHADRHLEMRNSI